MWPANRGTKQKWHRQNESLACNTLAMFPGSESTEEESRFPVEVERGKSRNRLRLPTNFDMLRVAKGLGDHPETRIVEGAE